MSFGFSVGDFLAVIQLVNASRKKWIDAPEEYHALRGETKSLSNVLRDLEDVVTEVDLTPRQQEDLTHARLACTAVLKKLQELEEKYIELDLPAKGFRERARRVWKRSKIEPDDIRNLRLQIVSTVATLTAILNSIITHIGSQTYDGVSEIRKTQEDVEKVAIIDWFAKATFAEQHSDLVSRRLQGAGQWLLDSSEYSEWTSCRKQTLLFFGIPGSGKTMISSMIIDDLYTRFENNKDVTVVYYYFDYARNSEQKLNGILASCVRQLLQTQPSLPSEAKMVYQKYQDRQTRICDSEELWNLLSSLLSLYSKVFFVFDALDECRNDDLTRDKLISGLFTQQVQSHTGMQLLVTTRPIQQITDQFSDDHQLEILATEQDVYHYLDAQMPRISWITKHVDLQESIKDNIVQAADGMFLLAKLHFDSLIEYTKPRDIRRALESLPKGNKALSQAYQKVRERIDGQRKNHRNLAHRVLCFITYAERILRIDELQHALAIEPGMKEIEPEEDLDEESLLLSLCAGLVTIDPESRHVRFVHYTTQEYLQAVRHEWLTYSQIDLARSCMSYLGMDEFACGKVQTQDELDDRLSRFPFVEHAAKFWGKYVLGLKDSTLVVDEVCDYLLDCGTRDFITQAMGLPRVLKSSASDSMGPANVAPLQIAAFFGLTQIVTRLIERGWEANVFDSSGGSPVSWAAFSGRVDVMELLLTQSNVDASVADDSGQTALHIAAIHNHSEVAKMLLAQPGVDVNSVAYGNWTALHLAAIHGHPEVMKVLLAQPGVDVNIADCFGWTVIHRATECGQLEMVKMLLAQPGVIANIGDKYGRTTIHKAAKYGDLEIVKMLLAYPGVDVNVVDIHGKTALWLADEEGHSEVIRLLEEHTLKRTSS